MNVVVKNSAIAPLIMGLIFIWESLRMPMQNLWSKPTSLEVIYVTRVFYIDDMLLLSSFAEISHELDICRNIVDIVH